ncbi:MAG: hypothetical protein LBT16_00660 [Treponema sp.]|jgi:hypothetical protein|nr:hypothetical protein [Treponema sp.]
MRVRSNRRKHGIAYHDGHFVAVGGAGIARSDDGGVNWATVLTYPSTNSPISIAYGNKWVAVGGATSSPEIGYSDDDGATWYPASNFSCFGAARILFIIYSERDDRFIAGSSNGEIGYSTNGITWSPLASNVFGTGSAVNDIAYGGGRYVAVGDGGETACSIDGTTWTVLDQDPGAFSAYDPIASITYNGSRFVAAGRYGTICYMDFLP